MVGLIAMSAPASGAERNGTSQAIAVEALTIPTFKVRSDETRFGKLEYLGGMQISTPGDELGGISAMRLLPDGVGFIGVMDTGFWFTGKLTRDEQSRLSGLSDFKAAAMRDTDGNIIQQRWQVDAEGLAIDGDRVLVSFERDHRIEGYRLADVPKGAPVSTLPLPIPLHEFRNNRGLEAIAVSPAGSALEGALVAVSEKSLNDAGDIYAALIDGSDASVFFVRRHAPFDITDGDFLPNGDLLLLERRFSLAQGVGMRIRRIKGGDIRPNATVDGEILIDADLGYQIDNMESLDVFVAADGSTRLLLASDDNHSLLQRSLVLEFRLHP